MKKPKLDKEYIDLLEKSNSVFATCEWIESEGLKIFKKLDDIENGEWSERKEITKNALIRQLLFLIKKGNIEQNYISELEDNLEKIKKKRKNAKSKKI
jgi:hypothetical protein